MKDMINRKFISAVAFGLLVGLLAGLGFHSILPPTTGEMCRKAARWQAEHHQPIETLLSKHPDLRLLLTTGAEFYLLGHTQDVSLENLLAQLNALQPPVPIRNSAVAFPGGIDLKCESPNNPLQATPQ